MSRAIAAHHGIFGRACLYDLSRPMLMHAHREGHIIFHLAGPHPHCTVTGERVEVTDQQAAAVSPLQPHDFHLSQNSAESVLVLVLYINPSWFLGIGGRPEPIFRFGRNHVDVTPEIRQGVDLIANLLAAGELDVALDGHLQSLTQASYHQTWQTSERSSTRHFEHHVARDHRIRKSIALMKERVSIELNLDDIASAVGLSRPHFYRLFRENMGITPNVYVNTLRMEEAIERLINTDQAVTSIGLDLGFATQASFTRFFGANVGIPPTDYRRVAQFG